jgi:hypothetical protein
MPYSGDVRMGGGFLREAGGELDVTTDATGAFWDTGFLRSPLGELVVTTSTAGAAWQGGYLRAANGALVVEDAEPTQIISGLFRTASGALAVEDAGTFAMSQGTLRTSTGRIAMPDLGGGVFDPSTISGLVVWLNAGALALSDGDPVTTWANDGSLTDFTQATGANKPTYKIGIVNGEPVVRFDGTDDLLNGPDISALTAGTVFIVVKADADPPAAGASGLWSFGAGGGVSTHYPWTDGRVYDTFGSTLQKDTGNPTLALTSFRLYCVRAAAGSWTSWVDGTQHYTTASNTVLFPATPKLGQGGSAAYHFDGDVAELLLYDSALSSTDRDSVEAYIAAKYALTIA